MQTLKLYRRAAWYMEEMRKVYPRELYEAEKAKVYTCLGEFAHAPGHHLMCEFGTWKLSGMHELENFEELDRHPDDFSITIPFDEE
jgi:hypothetical protein